jgi:GGDEF domain-containing protein
LKQRIHLIEQESIELRQSAMRSRDQALKDPLTVIWNRQALNELLEKEYAGW